MSMKMTPPFPSPSRVVGDLRLVLAPTPASESRSACGIPSFSNVSDVLMSSGVVPGFSIRRM